MSVFMRRVIYRIPAVLVITWLAGWYISGVCSPLDWEPMFRYFHVLASVCIAWCTAPVE